jgi:hypothetical protein
MKAFYNRMSFFYKFNYLENQQKMNSENIFPVEKQIAVSAIIHLASDIDSIHNFVTVVHYDSQIDIETESIYKEINEIATDAEKGHLNLDRITKAGNHIEKFALLIMQKKVSNPLIPDALIQLVETANKNAILAIVLTTAAFK